ncbi:MAG: hypothetical protein EOM21_13465 [Gammaproteobacteria bacterium]|nr:hypothetical protein [Gammaproteobacteria bacterium]
MLGTAPSAASTASGASYAVVPIHQAQSGLASGGQAGYTGVLGSFGYQWSLDQRSALGVRLRFESEDWRFDDPRAFAGVAPWGTLYRLGLSLPYSWVTANGWRWSLTPIIESAAESGARVSDSLEYGASLAGGRVIRPDLTLGLGVGVYDRIEETSVFPFVMIDWRISDQWRLSNPAATSPSGPAGLEISYALPSGYQIGLAAAYRSQRFRLDRDGEVPGGVGEHRSIPVLASIERRLSKGLGFKLYAGVALGSELLVEDASGRRLADEDRDPAALFGLVMSGRF